MCGIKNIWEPLSKDAINALPIVTYEGRVVLVDCVEQLPSACKLLAKDCILGFDTETRPTFKKGAQHEVSLLQLAGEDVVVLVRLNTVPFEAALSAFFADVKVAKVGVAVGDDIKALQRVQGFEPANVIDIAEMARKLGLKMQGLRTLSAGLFGQRVCKASRCSNWERESLTNQQIRYAATDAWMSRQLYKYLLGFEKI